MSSPNQEPLRLVSEWWLAAAPEQIWALLAAPEDWPSWWPQVRRCEPIAPGHADDLGAVRRTRWGSRLPYGVALDLRTCRVERPTLLEVEASGDLTGRGQWRLAPVGDGTRVRYTWEVWPVRPWMRRLAPWLAPLFAWNHHQAMRAGAQGMARMLGLPAPSYRARSGTEALAGPAQGVAR